MAAADHPQVVVGEAHQVPVAEPDQDQQPEEVEDQIIDVANNLIWNEKSLCHSPLSSYDTAIFLLILQ